MKKSQVKVTVEHYFNSMHTLISIINKLFDDDEVYSERREKEEIIEAFVLKLCAEWGIFVEELLVDCLNKDSSQYSKHMGLKLPKHIQRNQCRIMLHGLGYFDFRSTSDLQGQGKKILVPEHNPFKEISKKDAKKIDELFTIRNHLAHYSIKSERSLRYIYKNTYNLRQFRAPGDFLLAEDKRSKQPRFGNYTDAMHRSANSMAVFCGVEPIKVSKEITA